MMWEAVAYLSISPHYSPGCCPRWAVVTHPSTGRTPGKTRGKYQRAPPEPTSSSASRDAQEACGGHGGRRICQPYTSHVQWVLSAPWVLGVPPPSQIKEVLLLCVCCKYFFVIPCFILLLLQFDSQIHQEYPAENFVIDVFLILNSYVLHPGRTSVINSPDSLWGTRRPPNGPPSHEFG